MQVAAELLDEIAETRRYVKSRSSRENSQQLLVQVVAFHGEGEIGIDVKQ